MDYRERITIEPGKRSGKPCIRGLRITVYDILDYLAGGMSVYEILADFHDLEREDIRALAPWRRLSTHDIGGEARLIVRIEPLDSRLRSRACLSSSPTGNRTRTFASPPVATRCAVHTTPQRHRGSHHPSA